MSKLQSVFGALGRDLRDTEKQAIERLRLKHAGAGLKPAEAPQTPEQPVAVVGYSPQYKVRGVKYFRNRREAVGEARSATYRDAVEVSVTVGKRKLSVSTNFQVVKLKPLVKA